MNALAHRECRLVHAVVVGVGEAERRQHERRVARHHGLAERVDHRVGPDAVAAVEVLVLDEVEPDGRRAELGEGALVLGPPRRERVVAGREPAQLVPPRHRVRVARRRPREDRDHAGTGVRRQQVPAPEDGVVEMG